MLLPDEISDEDYEGHALTLPPPPRKGDQLFRGDLDDWRHKADLEGVDEPHVRGYQRAAEILVQHVIAQKGIERDYLVYPIVFLYRHHVELALKTIIRRTPNLLGRNLTEGEKSHLQQHRLDLLWNDLKPMLGEVYEAMAWDKPNIADLQGVDDYIAQITKLDPCSYGFRYSHSKKGGPSLPTELKHIDLKHFAEMANRLVNYVDLLAIATSLYEECLDDMEAEYR